MSMQIINNGDTGSVARAAINANFDELSTTKEDVANKDTDGTLSANSDVKYPSQKAVKIYADTKQTALGYTPENVANKDTDGALAANSDTKYPSQKATKTYVDTQRLLITNRQAASYSLILTDANKLVEMNNASANNLTVPLNASIAFTIGTQILLTQYGAGQTTVVATGGVTIRSKGGALKLTGQYSAATLVKIAADEWYLFGDITT